MEVLITRRPVFDGSFKVFGYKLVHSNLEPLDREASSTDSALQLIDNSALLFDLEALSGGKKAFFTFTRDALNQECAELLPAAQAVIDLHPCLEFDRDIVARCAQLRHSEYDVCATISSPEQASTPLLQVANIIGIDLARVSDSAVRQAIRDAIPHNKTVLVRSVDSLDHLAVAEEMGATYYEGKFFTQATSVTGSDLPGLKPNYLQLLKALHVEEPNLHQVSEIVRREVSLTYKLLRLCNSAAAGLNSRVESVDKALIVAGLKRLRQWAAVMAVAEMASNVPVELIVCSAVRGRFCEMVGQLTGKTEHLQSLFLMGLFSLLDVITHRPMNVLLDHLGLAGPAREALVNGTGEFRPVLDLVVAYEDGNWNQVTDRANQLGVLLSKLPGAYAPAVEWANESFAESTTEAAA